MENDGTNGYSARLDRIEGIMETIASSQADFEQEHKRLLTAQILVVDAQQKLVEAQQKTEERLVQLAETQKHTDERMDALIATVDDIIRDKK